MTPSDLGLPWPEWRPGQWEAIVRATTSDKSIVLIEAPPGIGKSGIALAIARLLDLQTHILTGTKQLQDQYATLPGVVTAKGRSNFDCIIAPVSADKAQCTAGVPCRYAGLDGTPGCPYYDQKREAAQAPVSVWNYAYWLVQLNKAGFPRPELLILDEAHSTKDHARGFVTVEVSQLQLRVHGLPEPPDSDDFLDHREWAKWSASTLYSEVSDLRRNPPSSGDRAGIAAASRLLNLYQTLHDLSRAKDEWVMDQYSGKTGYWWRYRPVWISQFIEPLFLRHASEVTVWMSATILDKATFCQLHGLEENSVEYIKLGSSFNKESRLVRYWPQGKVRRGDYGNVASAITRILGLHPSDRGIVHTVSYDLARAVVEHVQSPRLLSHTGRAGDRENALRRLRESPGAVLVSPSMGTGVDLPYDLLRFQVICKLPFPDLGDAQIRAAMKEVECPACPDDGTWCIVCRDRGTVIDRRGQTEYNYSTAATLIQTYGRIMRAADDAGTTYLLDENWKWFRSANRHLIPEWFSEAIKPWDGGYPSIEDQLGLRK